MSGQSRAIGRHGKRPSGGTSTGNESLSIQAQRVLARFASSLDETAGPPSVQRALDALRLGTDGQHLRLRDMLGLASAMARKVAGLCGTALETDPSGGQMISNDVHPTQALLNMRRFLSALGRTIITLSPASVDSLAIS